MKHVDSRVHHIIALCSLVVFMQMFLVSPISMESLCGFVFTSWLVIIGRLVVLVAGLKSTFTVIWAY